MNKRTNEHKYLVRRGSLLKGEEGDVQTIRAKGVTPSSSALALLVSTTADAPSLRLEALAAVTVPSGLKTGRRVGILSYLTCLYSSSSITTVSPPCSSGTSTRNANVSRTKDRGTRPNVWLVESLHTYPFVLDYNWSDFLLEKACLP